MAFTYPNDRSGGKVTLAVAVAGTHVVVLIDAEISTTPAEEMADSIDAASSSPNKPVKYDQEDLVNSQLQEAALRKRS